MKRQLSLIKVSKNVSSSAASRGKIFQRGTPQYNSFYGMSSRLYKSTLCVSNTENQDIVNSENIDAATYDRQLFSSVNHCQSCGKPIDAVQTVNVNNRFKHCYDCNMLYATSSGGSSHQSDVLKPIESFIRRPPYPSELNAYLDKYVIGQSEAKRTLAVGVYSHYRRLACNAEQRRIAESFINVHSSNSASDHNGPVGTIPNGILHFNVAAATGQPDFTGAERSHHQYYQKSTISASDNSMEDSERLHLDKSNILLLGPSGVGKTFVTQILARILDVPIALGDCTSMTQAGYVGEDVESVLQKLLANAQNDVERAQRGIVFLDEIDKIAATAESSNHSYRDVSGEGVQHALLKLVEGTVANVKSDKKGPNGQQAVVPIDTSDILFIASGAFTGLEKIVGKRLDQRAVGFGTGGLAYSITVDDKEQEVINEKRDKLISKADQGDIIKFGMIPEIVGRFPILVPFHSLNKEMLVRVLTEPRNSILAQMKMHFAMDGVSLQFTESALEEIAQLALERKTGARALRSIIEKVLLLAKYEVPGSDIESVRVSRECVRNASPYEYIRRQTETVNVAAAGGI